VRLLSFSNTTGEVAQNRHELKILCENFDKLHVAENADVMAVAGG